MPTTEQLQEENERLRAELESYKTAEQKRQQQKGNFTKRLSSLGSWFFLGGDLKQSIKQLVVEVRDKDQKVSDDTLGNVLAHGAWRLTRIGCFGVLVALIPLVILVVQTTLLYFQNEKIDIQNTLVEKQNEKIDAQNIRLDQQTNLQEAERRSSLVFLFSNVMDAVDRELKDINNKERKLSKQLIGRIIALSASLKPYKYLTEGDTLTSQLLSPERGQLLISLVESDLDSVTYLNIFRKANFEYADLKGADLNSVNLNDANLVGANLAGANLIDAGLIDVDLMDADLMDAKLINAKLMNVNLTSANLMGANLMGARLMYARLMYADLYAVNLNNANLNNAKLNNADLYFANLMGAKLIGANLSFGQLIDANLVGANLRGANLGSVNLAGANLRGMNLTGANLNDAKTDALNFLINLDQDMIGHKHLQRKYYLDSIPQYERWDKKKEHPYYLIKPKPKKQ